MSNAVAEAPQEIAATEPPEGFIDRRSEDPQDSPARERRQFTNSHTGLSDEAAELARAIDQYKAERRRRFIDYEEMLSVVKSLGYRRS